jgi:hypothetical protein
MLAAGIPRKGDSTMQLRVIAVAFAVGAFAAAAYAAESYQVTGPIVSVTDQTIVVEKNKEKWEIARTPDTKVAGGDLKVGTKVTIQYSMTAKSIEVKEEKAKPKEEKAAVKDEKAKPKTKEEPKKTEKK